jgi:hypothetical protein
MRFSFKLLSLCASGAIAFSLFPTFSQEQQAPPEFHTCKANQELKDGVCVPKSKPHEALNQQSGQEKPPSSAPPKTTIPRCKKGEELIDDKCTPTA